MRYRNTITGAEFEAKSLISAPNWIRVDADNDKEEPKAAPPSLKKTAAKSASKKGAKK